MTHNKQKPYNVFPKKLYHLRLSEDQLLKKVLYILEPFHIPISPYLKGMSVSVLGNVQNTPSPKYNIVKMLTNFYYL